MPKPVLVVMAAGMGSRYGGLKQIDPVDEQGHIIMDFSVYDAVRAGFDKVVFIIKRENEEIFREAIGKRVEPHVKVEYVFQDLTNIPEGFQVPEGRVKPWGTGHAVLSCLGTVTEPFAVINADDYYGVNAFQMAYNALMNTKPGDLYQFMMVGYHLGNTLTENGFVSRGICTLDDQNYLTDIVERTHIEHYGDGAAYTEDDGKTWTELPMDCTVSMNMWGFTADFLNELESRFETFLKKNLPLNPLKCECYLPFMVDELLKEKKAEVKVEKTTDKWFGVTYKEDKPMLTAAIAKLKAEGVYPENLWG